ncbi:MAG: cyclase family protein [Methanomicrobiaceae archaeon]|uniref:Metal-dependent hydrolase n=1 Tax=hydrocarbon metagenome TaxID=938273 RepID=A0A0W8FKF1_9ZZZZ|nr:cyclase family protein [Methanomicrobiaceae archaeon]MDD5419693.1 cyclase family protein [Methanomicrobiaceae archaeon]
MIFYDVTRELAEDVVVYPGDHVPRMHQEDCGQYLISHLSLSTHSGTHVDAPSHYLKNGLTVDCIPLSHLIGRARVLDLQHADGAIQPGDLAGRMEGASRLLIRTWFSGHETFEEGYPALTPAAADALAAAGIVCVGIDTPSIEGFFGDGSVHRRLLGAGIVVLELLDLSEVREGDYYMVALPLRLKGLDGSPARVVLCSLPGEEEL